MVEETGGLMTLDGSRRRTPGGVYMFLIRNDKTIDKETVDAIFEPDRKFLKLKSKKMRELKKAAAKADNRSEENIPSSNQDVYGLHLEKFGLPRAEKKTSKNMFTDKKSSSVSPTDSCEDNVRDEPAINNEEVMNDVETEKKNINVVVKGNETTQ